MMTEENAAASSTATATSGHNAVRQSVQRLGQRWQGLLDKCTPHAKARWVGAVALIGLFLLRVFLSHGWYIVTYALGIYHLNLFIAFLTPKMDPALDLDGA